MKRTIIITTFARRNKTKRVSRMIYFHGLYNQFVIFLQRLAHKFGKNFAKVYQGVKGGLTYAQFRVTV